MYSTSTYNKYTFCRVTLVDQSVAASNGGACGRSVWVYTTSSSMTGTVAAQMKDMLV